MMLNERKYRLTTLAALAVSLDITTQWRSSNRNKKLKKQSAATAV